MPYCLVHEFFPWNVCFPLCGFCSFCLGTHFANGDIVIMRTRHYEDLLISIYSQTLLFYVFVLQCFSLF